MMYWVMVRGEIGEWMGGGEEDKEKKGGRSA
jgi:hypothetical protein